MSTGHGNVAKKPNRLPIRMLPSGSFFLLDATGNNENCIGCAAQKCCGIAEEGLFVRSGPAAGKIDAQKYAADDDKHLQNITGQYAFAKNGCTEECDKNGSRVLQSDRGSCRRELHRDCYARGHHKIGNGADNLRRR